MFDAEQEHWDHENGAMTSLQMAYAESRASIQIVDETKKIEELVVQGKHVVSSGYPVCCPSTDAYIGRAVFIDGIFDTREEAMEFFNTLAHGAYEGDFDTWVSPVQQPEPRDPKELEDIFMSNIDDLDVPF